MSQHRCIGAANEALQAKNTRLSMAMEIPSGQMRLIIATEVLTKKRGAKPVKIMATYCPFCGEKLNEK